jgi:hypothetical protein
MKSVPYLEITDLISYSTIYLLILFPDQ